MTATPPGETILLVEDEPSIRHFIRRTIEGIGSPWESGWPSYARRPGILF